MVSACNSDSEPPQLLVGAEAGVVEVPGYDYCWDGVCADWFGSQVPTPLTFSESAIRIEWIKDGVLTATVSDETGSCALRPALDQEDSPGVWNLTVPACSPPYRVIFHGSEGENSTLFVIEVISSTAG